MFSPVLSKLQISKLKKILAEVYFKEHQQLKDLESAFVDKQNREQLLNIILKTSESQNIDPHVMQSMDIANLEKIDLLDSGEMQNRSTVHFTPSMRQSELDINADSMRVSTANIAERINENYFEPISRYLPHITQYLSVESQIEPLSKVFENIQLEHKEQVNKRRLNYKNTRSGTDSSTGTLSTAHTSVKRLSKELSGSPTTPTSREFLSDFIEVPSCTKL